MKYKIFVDGLEGTTGLQIHQRLAGRDDLDILKIDPEKRKDIETRRTLLNEADLVFLCLPDAASKESVSLVSNPDTRIIDASTAYRTDSAWTYGIPELNKGQRKLIAKSKRLTNPGCYATGFIMSLYPLVQEGIVPRDYPVSCSSVSGYSGGGKKLIEQYETVYPGREKLDIPRFYALTLSHKHIPEMQKITGLTYPPVFTPIVANYYKGMGVSIPLAPRQFSKKMDAKAVHAFMTDYYKGERFVRVIPFESGEYLDNGAMNHIELNDTNRIDLFVFGNSEQILLFARFDNLGKGASGAAVQNMNIMLGLDEGLGLN